LSEPRVYLNCTTPEDISGGAEKAPRGRKISGLWRIVYGL